MTNELINVPIDSASNLARVIARFVLREYDSDFMFYSEEHISERVEEDLPSTLRHLREDGEGLMYTTITGEDVEGLGTDEHELQVTAYMDKFSLRYFLDGKVYYEETYDTPEDLAWALDGATFDSLYSDALDKLDSTDVLSSTTDIAALKDCQDLVSICVYKDSTGRYSDEECNQDNTVDLQFPVRILWAWYNNMMERPCVPDEFWYWLDEQSTADDTDGLVQFAEKYYDYHVEFPGTTVPEPGNDTGAMVEYTDGSESWEDVHYTVSYKGKAFSTDQGTINYQHYNSWEKAITMYDYCEDHELDPYLHDNHYGVYLHCDEWN